MGVFLSKGHVSGPGPVEIDPPGASIWVGRLIIKLAGVTCVKLGCWWGGRWLGPAGLPEEVASGLRSEWLCARPGGAGVAPR